MEVVVTPGSFRKATSFFIHNPGLNLPGSKDEERQEEQRIKNSRNWRWGEEKRERERTKWELIGEV